MEIIKKTTLIISLSMSLLANDIIVKDSSCSVEKTIENLKNIVESKKLNVFAIVDHGQNAKKVSMDMNPSKMIIFANPELGTLLMKEEIKVGLDLPLRILVYKDNDGKVKMAYRDGSWLAKEHKLDLPKKIQKINNAMDKITTKAGTCKID